MAGKVIVAGTSILIEYFRKTNKVNSAWIFLFDKGYDFRISAITHYEIYSGTTPSQMSFWKKLLDRTEVLPFDEAVAQTAVEINNALKTKRKQVSMADLFIAATAITNNIPLATLNRKHFDRIDGLKIIE